MKKILEKPGYRISNNDLKLLLGGDESDFTEEDEELIELEKRHFDEILSQNKLNQDKYSIKMITTDPRYPVVKVVEKDYVEKPEKGVVTFDDTDLDEGLLNKRSFEVLKNLKLPLPSKKTN